ncbi:MAG TPA: TIGR02587 family membrane protein [Woeseiaceae bacterium]|nr:TIGR02587 family membrane protein [Woeseiaceae bacterium]
MSGRSRSRNVKFWITCSRGVGGALIFSLPLILTMEMWWLGFYVEPARLLLFLVLLLPTLYGLSYYSGFEPTADWTEDVLDALVAFAIGIVVSVVSLAIIAVLRVNMPVSELVGKVTLMAAPASFGAVLASKQLGQQSQQNRVSTEANGYGSELFIMAAGALFLSFSVAPTEEMVLIAHMMTPWHALLLALVSLVVMDAVVFGVGFRGQVARPPDTSFWRVFLNFTVVGYAIALLISAYVLWTFGRFEGMAPLPALMSTVVLAFPGALGAAISRLIV